MIKNKKVSTQELLDIDRDIDQLVKQIELLSYVNPINIEEEKAKFFSSKYLTLFPSLPFIHAVASPHTVK